MSGSDMRKLMETLSESVDDWYNEDRDRRFRAFINDLEMISKKHGVTIEAVGSVEIYDNPLTNVQYDKDYTSGDLMLLNATE